MEQRVIERRRKDKQPLGNLEFRTRVSFGCAFNLLGGHLTAAGCLERVFAEGNG